MTNETFKSLMQWLAVIVCIAIFIVGAWMSVSGGLEAMKPTSPGDGLFLIVIGGVFMAMAGIVISIAGKLLGEK